MDPVALYADTRVETTELVRSLSPEEHAAAVPGCPGWLVRDVVAHLLGVCEDFAAGNLEGAAGDDWSARQVERHRATEVGELLELWAKAAPSLDATLASAGLRSIIPVVDLVTHQQDIRGAVGRAGGRDTAAFDVSLQQFVAGFDRRVKQQQLPALTMRAPEQEWTVGEGDPAVVVEVDAFELFRSLAGRRGVDQVRAFNWSADPEPYLAVFNTFGALPTGDVVER